jgi:hypothetical protein
MDVLLMTYDQVIFTVAEVRQHLIIKVDFVKIHGITALVLNVHVKLFI